MLNPKIIRFVVHIDWRCKYCKEIFGAENVRHYGTDLPQSMVQPTWFFAAMSLLDHLRDCRHKDYTEALKPEFGDDFLNNPAIKHWFTLHALLERRLVDEQDLD